MGPMSSIMDQIDPAEPRLNKERLSEIINTLRPDGRMNAGRVFFQRLLLSDGVDGVYAFLEKARVALDKQGELELFDFSEENGERDAFNKAREKTMTRRFMLGVLGEGFGGAALGAYGGLGVGHQATQLVRGEPLTDPAYHGKDGFDHTRHRLDETVMPTAYTAIGAGMVYMAGKNYYMHRLSDVANAVERLGEKLSREQQRAGAVRG